MRFAGVPLGGGHDGSVRDSGTFVAYPAGGPSTVPDVRRSTAQAGRAGRDIRIGEVPGLKILEPSGGVPHVFRGIEAAHRNGWW
jgi:hypothetical protein